MGQVLHGSATTTHAIRAAIQRSKAPREELASRIHAVLTDTGFEPSPAATAVAARRLGSF